MVVVRVEVTADGSVRRPEIERSSGLRLIDQRALDALRAVASFDPPPTEMLTPAGVTDLSFQLRLGR
ncbi:energy transducer TonB [Methylobacterium sp. J-070]|nr:energy transducer TonB [Methylobacterium sp. J-070]